MANDDNYIGVAMGLDVTDLKAGLKETSMRMKEANAEFKTVAASMDNWQQSVEGVRAKVRQLDTVLTAQQQSLAGLQAEYQRVSAEQGENSDVARRLQLRIQGQQAAINTTQRELNNYRETLTQAEAGNIDLTQATLRNGRALDEQSSSAENSSKSLEGMGKVAKGVAGGIAAIGVAVAGAVTGFLSLAESTREFREDQAKLNSAFEGANLNAKSAEETYRTLFGVIGESDTAVEASQQIALLANSEEEVAKWADLATGVVGTFGDALKAETFYEAANETIKLGEATGAFTQMLEGTGYSVDEFNAGLAALSTEEEKQAYMLEISNQLLGKQGEAYNEIAKDVIEAREAEAGLTQATAELGAIAEPIMTTLKILATDLIKSITPFVELIGNGLKGALEGTEGAAETLAEGLGGIVNVLVEKVTNMLPTILNIILQLIPSIASTLLNSLPTLVDTVTKLVIQIVNLLGELLPTIVQSIIDIVPKIIESLVTAIPQLLEAAITFLMAIVQAIPTLINNLVSTLPEIINTIIDSLILAIPILIQGSIQLFTAIVDAIPIIIQQLIVVLPTIIDAIITGLLKMLPVLLNACVTLLMAIVQAIPQILPVLIVKLPQIIQTINMTLLKNIPAIINAAVQLYFGILEAIPLLIIELVKSTPKIISEIVKGLKSGVKDMKGVGKDLIEGIWSGIYSGADWLRNKITGFAGDVSGWFKKTFKIASPSKETTYDGLMLGEGIGEGLMDSLPLVKKNLSKFSNVVSANLGDIKNNLSINAGSPAVASGNVGGNSQVINAGMTINYNGNLSRKQIMQLENDQYTMIKTKLKMEGAI